MLEQDQDSFRRATALCDDCRKDKDVMLACLERRRRPFSNTTPRPSILQVFSAQLRRDPELVRLVYAVTK